jgi:hypothetical protein
LDACGSSVAGGIVSANTRVLAADEDALTLFLVVDALAPVGTTVLASAQIPIMAKVTRPRCADGAVMGVPLRVDMPLISQNLLLFVEWGLLPFEGARKNDANLSSVNAAESHVGPPGGGA